MCEKQQTGQQLALLATYWRVALSRHHERPTPGATEIWAAAPTRPRDLSPACADGWEKRRKRSHIQVRLKANPHTPAVPSILPVNTHSLDNKRDILQPQRVIQKEISECFLLTSADTWLNEDIPDTAIQRDGLSLHG